MLSTAKIVESFQAIPGEITLDEAVERLIILDRYERAMEEMGQNKGHKNEDVIREMKEWIQAQR
ncbi:hypothetical protein BN8_00732 [Fibrisoma limi BUZ 3]|uniref:Uncharacterized protein n=1 Tax=Fibrisoma limi BUZ 3 TaxID=1185876 RepID=I2GD12_9BACT|nr:hypothetical protein [Fibrisoma limi]CCH51786.1 hypothetical protein BN8_00732 [Fibrisoma limi BUZ 3]